MEARKETKRGRARGRRRTKREREREREREIAREKERFKIEIHAVPCSLSDYFAFSDIQFTSFGAPFPASFVVFKAN